MRSVIQFKQGEVEAIVAEHLRNNHSFEARQMVFTWDGEGGLTISVEETAVARKLRVNVFGEEFPDNDT